MCLPVLDAVNLWTLQQNELSAGAVGTFQPYLGQGSYQGATGSVAPSCVPRCWWSCAGRAVHCRAAEQEPVKLQLVKTPSAVACSAQLLVGRFTLLFFLLREGRSLLSLCSAAPRAALFPCLCTALPVRFSSPLPLRAEGKWEAENLLSRAFSKLQFQWL